MDIGNWSIHETEFIKENVEQNGSRFLIGNGFMGFRGTLEEFGKEQLVSLNLAGLFDKNGDLWRESVNAPNPFFVKAKAFGKELNPLEIEPVLHTQTLNINCGVHERETVYEINGAKITVSAERFLSLCDENLAVLKYKVKTDKPVEISVETKVDTDVWNINGDHFAVDSNDCKDGVNILKLHTLQNNTPMAVYEYIEGAKNIETVSLKAGEEFSFVKLCGVFWGDGVNGSLDSFKELCKIGFDAHLQNHKSAWDKVWENADVLIEGDSEAQFALRYSIYHLNSIVPRNTDKCGIPARGLSGQVYKGASFWDTEMFMLPFFSFTDTKAARNLLKYRINTLDGAKRKAEMLGYEGAFFAWESQETGDDACTLFNVTDIFTNRPLRTYFMDKQIHISADIVIALWDYCVTTGDYGILLDGGLNLMYECLWFFYTYSVFKPYKNRYELYDAIGPDEYHERVNNNAFTNVSVKHAADYFVAALEKVKTDYPEYFKEFGKDIDWIYDFSEKLYVPQPNEKGIIEQFDGYFKLEDVTPEILKTRELKPNEYWGGHGLASTTMTLKQADVVMMLNVFRNEYSKEIKKANWEFYEPYTEHGSSLSACAYAIVAAETGNIDWAYKYFMKTASVDLTGATKQYVGSLYIGGTHPAANGGAWNTAIFGFAGVSFKNDTLDISPRLPKNWKSLAFKLNWKGEKLNIKITADGVNISGAVNSKVTVYGKEYK